MLTRGVIFLLIIGLLAPGPQAVRAAQPAQETLDIILKRYSAQRGLTDWEALVLGVNGVPVKTPLFDTNYFKRVENDIRDAEGSLRLVTDYARIALAWAHHQKDPRQIAGYDFIAAVEEFPARKNQGVNAYIWSLMALYGQDKSLLNELAHEILRYQCPSGGFSFSLPTQAKPDPSADVDITAMAVTALAPYAEEYAVVDTAVKNAVDYFKDAREPGGGYANTGVENAESLSWVIVALCSAGENITLPYFVHNGKSLLDLLDAYHLGDGYYAHTLNGEADPIATRQAALALSAVRRAAQYDAMTATERETSGIHRGILEIMNKPL